MKKAKAFIDWQKQRTFREDFDATVRTIVAELGAASSSLGRDRPLQFIATHDRIFRRVDDCSGGISSVYQHSAAASPGLAEAMSAEKR